MPITGTVRIKKIDRRVLRATRRKLVSFYLLHQHFLPPLTLAEDTLMWELIFQYFFGEMPVDDTTKEVPHYYRQGSTDPRWDDLFFKQYALTAHKQLLQLHMRHNILKQQTREAA